MSAEWSGKQNQLADNEVPYRDGLGDEALAGDLAQAVLPIARIRCTAVAVGPVQFGARLGTHLRGAIGWYLRYAHCPSPNAKTCQNCNDLAPCPYRLSYEAAISPDRVAGSSRHQDWPRPLWVRASGQERTVRSGELFDFEIVAIGAMCDYLPDVVSALMQVQTSGLGRKHAWFRLAMVQSLAPDGTVLAQTPHRELVRNRLPIEICEVLVPAALPLADAPVRITLDFLSPMSLRAGEPADHVPRLDALLNSLGRRTRLLAERWGQPLTHVRWPVLGRWELAGWEGHWLEWERVSGTQGGAPYKLRGFVGRVAWRADAGHVLDWLRLGELLHVGSDIQHGLGQYRILDVC